MTPRYRIQFKSYGHSGRATVFVTLMVVIHWVSMLGLIAWLLSNGTPISPEERLPLLIFFAFGIYLLLMARDRWRVYKNPPFIEFAEKKVLLPRGRYGSKSEWVNYDKILSFRVSGRPPLRFCLIGAGGKNFFFSESRFEDKDVFSTFVLELRTRIRNLPEGEKQIALIDHNVTFAQAIWSRPAQVSYSLVIIIFLSFIMEYSLDMIGEPFALIRLGANSPLLLAEGQYYRLITSNFLHVGWLHVIVNLIALYGLGSVVERIIGPHRYICVYFLSGIAGALASSLLAQAPLSVGASSAIFGVLGSLLMLNIQFKGRLPASFSQSRSWWIFILGTSAALPLILPQIDAGAHIGGFVVGVLVTFLLIRDYQAEGLIITPSTSVTKVLSASMLTLTAFGIIFGLIQAGKTNAADEEKVMSHFVSSEKSDHKALNRFAWNIVTDPSSTKKERQLAGEAARRADQKAPGRPEILDTLANVYFLQGSIDEAIELQTEAIEKFDAERTKDREDDISVLSEEAYQKQVQSLREVYISQLARFEYALFLRDGPPPGAWKIALSFEPVSESKTSRVRVRLDKPYLKGIQIHAAVVQGTLLTGHLAITLPPSDKTEFFHEFQEGPLVSWSKSSRLDIVLVQEKDVSKGHWIATKYAAEVARLPAKPIQ